MRVFITGGAGFIGSHLVDHYLAEGNEVSILDNLSTGSLKNIEHCKNEIQIHQGDIRDEKLVNKLVSKSDLVLHMAAALGVNTILESTVESVSTNYTGSEVVLKAALKNDKRILIASTSEVYGKNPKQPLSETDDRVVGAPQKIRWTYSDAKALEEAIAHSLYLNHGLPVTTIRLFNTVGPRQTGRYGMVIPRFVKAALTNNDLLVYGNGSQSRVFCHVLDAIDAMLKLINEDESIGQVYNIGGVEEISIENLAHKIILKLNSNSRLIYVPYSEAYLPGYEDIQRRVPNLSKIQKTINWQPIRDLNNIIDEVARNSRVE